MTRIRDEVVAMMHAGCFANFGRAAKAITAPTVSKELSAAPAAKMTSVLDALPVPPHGMLLVTNNIDAVDAFGFKSKLFLVDYIIGDAQKGYSAYTTNCKMERVTHWAYNPIDINI